MSIADDIDEAISKAVTDAKTTTTWPGTIITVNPLTVQLDGSGIAVDCLAADFVSVVAQRRCVVQQVGSQLVVMATFGGAQLDDLTLSDQLISTKLVSSSSAIGSDTLTSATFIALNVPVSIVFTTPPSGKVIVALNARVFNSTVAAVNPTLYIGYEIRVGSTVGSGTPVVGVATSRSVGCRVITSIFTLHEAGRFDIWTLTPNTIYNVQALGANSDAGVNLTGSADGVQLHVIPCI